MPENAESSKMYMLLDLQMENGPCLQEEQKVGHNVAGLQRSLMQSLHPALNSTESHSAVSTQFVF